MKHELRTEADFAGFPSNGAGHDSNHHAPEALHVLNVADVLALDTPAPSMLIEQIVPERGASLIVGAAKSNKTLLAVQMGIAVASGNPFLENYRVLRPGPVLIVEQDDPGGAASLKTILGVSPVPVADIPFFLAPRVPFNFGSELLAWLEEQIVTRGLHLVVLDSYTSLRGSRGNGIDIVKAEQHDLTMLDELAKRTGCAIVVIHHASKGAATLDWDSQAAGTFAMTAATESQMHVSRFRDLDGNAPERLIRIRGRHQEGLELVVRFRKGTLDHEHVLEGGAAPLFPLIAQLQTAFGAQPFGPKELTHATGVSRATAHRQIDRLYRADVLTKRGYGEYVLSGVRQ
jgi:AAA domain